MKKTTLLSIFSIALILSAKAQQGGFGNMAGMGEMMKIGRFYGRIIDSTSNKAVEYASVQLIGNMYDTTTKTMKKDVVVAGQLTQENGDFSLEKLSVLGKYRLKISALGYKEKIIPISFDIDMSNMKKGGGMSALNGVDKDLGNLKVQLDVQTLSGVDIVSEAPILELKLDKKVFNVDKTMSTEGGTAEDVLKKVPSVNVDMDGNVTMRNAPPQIFVDGRPTTLSIDQIPSDAIESIELITNPSAKYDATGGQGGILNIVLKKDRRIGYNGNIRASIDQFGKPGGGFNINAREGKINVFLSSSLNNRYNTTEGYTDRQNLIGSPLTNLEQDFTNTFNGLFMHNRGGVDWFMNNRNTLTLSGNYFRGKFNSDNLTTTFTDTLGAGDSYNTRDSKTNREFSNAGASVLFKHLFPKPDQEITADFNFNKVRYENGGDFYTNYFDGNYNQVGNVITQNNAGSGSNQIMSGQFDYKHPIDSSSKFETGIKGSSREFKSKLGNFLLNDSTGEFETIANQTSNYGYTDNVFGAYILYGKKINKISYQAGLRSESSFYTGELIDSGKTFKNFYPASFFPSLSMTYDVNKKNNFQFSYSRRINRPSFFQIIPYTDYSDSLNLSRGNAGLKPEFTHSLELSYLKMIGKKNNSILGSVYFKTSTDLITSYMSNEFDTVLQKNVVISSFENADASYIYGGELTSSYKVGKWLEFTLNINAYYSVLDAENIGSAFSDERISWFTKENISFKMGKHFKLEITPEYYSRVAVPLNNNEKKWGGWGSQGVASAQGYKKERYVVDASLRYSFMKNDAASLTFSVDDIFKSNKEINVNNSDYYTQTSERLRNPQFFRLNFNYRFGKFDVSLFKRKNMNMNAGGMDMM